MKKENSKGLIESLEGTVIKHREKIFVTLVLLLFIIFLLNSFFVIDSTHILNNKINELNELNIPANISLSIINCNSCSNLSSVIEGIKNKNVNILKSKSFNYNSNDAKVLIKKYGIQKLPSVIITGEINTSKTKFNNFELKNNALVLEKVKAPYFDIASKEIKGRVRLVELLDSSCKECFNLSSISLGFTKAGVSISDLKKVEYNSVEGKGLINKFGIKEVPALLISDGIKYYRNIDSYLEKLGLNESQGYYILHSVQPPYRNLSNNKIVGLVNLIMLTDKSCTNCYNVSINKKILNRLGIVIKNENTYDINSSEGKKLILKYSIQEVPIILLSPEAKEYGSFINAWKPVGSIENDGWFVMRKPEALGTVKDIVNGTIIGTKK